MTKHTIVVIQDTTPTVVVPLDLLDMIHGRAEELAERFGDVALLSFLRVLDVLTDGQRQDEDEPAKGGR